MKYINLFDTHFSYAHSSTDWKHPKSFSYVKREPAFDGITIFSDSSFNEVDEVDCPIKIAWQVESPVFSDHSFYEMMNSHPEKFDKIITYDEDLIKSNPEKFLRGQFGGTTVYDPQLYTKSKDICTVFSGKLWTPNQEIRKRVIDSFPNVDSFGRGTERPFDNVADVYKDYRFVIVIENVDHPVYFSEKLTDAMACGCVPIYKGSKESANKYFNDSGFILWETFEELQEILSGLDLSQSSYESFNVEDNMNIVKRDFYTNEDWLYERYLKEFM